MKNLFAIPRLSPSEAFTILITLVVYLAGFTEAEIYSDYKKEDSSRQEENNFLPKGSSFKENDQRTLEASNAKSDELKQNYLPYLKSLPESPLDKLNERYSVYFGKSDESNNEKKNDEYNYDEDEYYHFNYKRNDQNVKKLENSKLQKQRLNEPERKGMLGQNYFTKNMKDLKDKELKTIEMLDFKEYHPNLGLNPSQNSMQNSFSNSIQNQKQFSKDLTHKKIPSSEPMDTLNIMDFKDDSAIDESLKDRKEESSSVLASAPSDSKIAEVKKAVKTTDEKDSVKLKDLKSVDDSVKKDKEISLKDGKEVVSAKNLKDSSKSSEEKEKTTVNLSESSKLEGNFEKISSNNKESDTAKISKEDKDMSRFSNRVTSDVINPKEISQIENRANFVNNEYKESLDSIKTSESQINEKNSEDINENEKNIGLNNAKKSVKEKQYNLMISEKNDDFGLLNGQYDLAKVVQNQEKSAPYFTVPLNYEFQEDKPKEMFKKRESWKTSNNMQAKLPQQQVLTQEQTLHHHGLLQQPQRTQLDLTYESQQKQNPFQNSDNNFPTNELQNTDYYKNYLKSLRKYKSQNENSKNVNSEPSSSGYNLVRKISFRDEAENKKKKRSKPKKRRLLLSEEMSQEKEKEQIDSSNLGKNSYKTQDTLPSQSAKCMVPVQNSQSSLTEGEKKDANLLEGKKCEEQLENSRLRRKSPLKLEYEIKVINQSPQDSKNVQFSRFSPRRLKKDVKTKVSTGDKYLKKYPYSQVSRDDLTGLNKVPELENEKKYKRKAYTEKRFDQKSIKTRAAPSNYYSNRVKFGQKSYARNNEKTNSDRNPVNVNRMSSPYLSPSSSSNIDKNYQPGWESKQQNLNNDEDAYLREDNSLFLVKKGERTAKAFEEDSKKSSLSSEELDPEQLAKILSQANDYVVLKKTENNKFRKISDYEPSSFNPSDFDNSPLYDKKSTFAEQLSQYNLETNERPAPLDSKSLRTRSNNLRKDDKKYSATFRSSASKSNLRKTLDKFRDLADFFKDSEQESVDSQYSAQEAKEGRDIVFSEDKLPDPIVISSDGSETMEGLKQKPQNSIYSISTNFKNIDMPGKKSQSAKNDEKGKNMFTAGVKSDSPDMSWEPALKNIFPEAKTINAMNKNGNEIIVLDFDRNQLKSQHGFHVPQKMSKAQPFGTYSQSSRMPSTNPLNFLGDRKVQLILEGDPLSPKGWDKSKSEEVKIQMLGEPNRNYAHMSSEEKQPTMSIPLEFNELPSLLKNIKKNVLAYKTKTVRKKSKEDNNSQFENYKQFLTNLDNLSENNKNSFTRKYYKEPDKERNLNNLPSSSFSELSTYSDFSIKQLGNLLQNIMPKDGSLYREYDNKNIREMPKNSKEYQNLGNAHQDAEKYGVDYALERPSQWFSNEKKNEDKSVSKEDKDEMDNIQNQEMNKIKEKNYEQFREQTEKASDKVHRLRREEMENKNLMEHEMTLKESEDSDAKSQVRNIKMTSDLVTHSSNDLIADGGKNEEESEFQASKKADESKENSEQEESLDSEYDNHLSEFFESLSKNPKNPNESTWNRKKRKNTQRQKRFSGRDLEEKVSKTEVQNTILKNLPEDNYQSVYSPGIKRRLLSIKNEADNADADELDKNTAKESQENSVKNAANKYTDPIILQLFGSDGYEEEKSRARRSLTSTSHTNFKREIDLDESMPNDFQNFLVTSLGGVGSQKREVVKKDEALWGGKENPQDSYNQIVESSSEGKETNEDSALEKREVSENENRKTQSYSKPNYYSSPSGSSSNFAGIMNSFNRAEKKIRSDSKSKVESKTSEFTDEKLPTQIRIQIMNGSSKEKKSSKPIMDESETSSTDVENLPKEKEFFDKSKINPFLSNNLPKFHQASKTKFPYDEYKEDENKGLNGKQKAHYLHRRKKRKRKKYIPETPMKPVKDFITFDQKAMETLLRNYKLNQNMMSDQTTQKIPVSHPLPQVETVYNPTQGTNKAQLETVRLGKMNSINNKNAENSKNSLQSNDASTYDESVIRSYLKSDKIKSNKGELKEFEDVDWKPYTRKLGLGQEAGQFEVIHPTQKIQTGSPSTFSINMDTHPLNTYSTPNVNSYGQKLFQTPYSRFFYHTPSPSAMNNQLMYDVLKLKQEMKNNNGMNKDHMNNKPYSKPYHFYDGMYEQEEKDKAQNPATSYPPTVDRTWNYFDHSLNKKPYSQKFRIKDYYPLSTKSTNQMEQRTKNPYLAAKKFLKNFNFDKLLNINNQPLVMENYRDIDYLDTTDDGYSGTTDDDYLDEYPSKDSQSDEPLTINVSKKLQVSTLQETPAYYHIYGLKAPDIDDGLNEDDYDLDEDYEENADEEDLDDYSLLKSPNIGDPKLTKKNHGTEELQSDQSTPNIFAQLKYYNPEPKGYNTELSKFISSVDDKFDLGAADVDFEKRSDPLLGSTVLLQKANENSKVFSQNVLENLNRFGNNPEWNLLKENQGVKNSDDWRSVTKNDLNAKKFHLKEKLKRSQEFPRIGSRLYYAAKTEINNDRDITPSIKIHKAKDDRNKKRSYYRTPWTNSFHDEFAGSGNDFDIESEQNEKHVGENLMISEENGFTQKEEYSKNENEDIKENLEDDGDAIALDNYLENVIGKYIMRKAIKPSTNSDKASIQKVSDDSIKNKIKKRSIRKQKFTEKKPKFLIKRLSSGHLTENNFRKYHKKNFSRKRHIKDLHSSPYEVMALIRNEQNVKTKDRNVENEKQKKRSALDIFKKITNKDRDNKKAENSEGRTAGFEPLLSLTDKKYDNAVKDSPLVHDKKSFSETPQTETKGNLPELKAHYPNEGQHLRAQLNEKKGEKSKEALKEYPTSSAQGPWRVELNDRFESKAAERTEKEHRKSLKSSKIIDTKLLKDNDDSLKAFLVISKNVRTVKRNPVDNLFPISGLFRREISNSYWPESDENKGISEKQVWKRSTVGEKNVAKDIAKISKEQIPESHVNTQEKNRALYDIKSLSEGDSKHQAPHVLQRNVKKNGSLVTANEQRENSQFLSRERLTKSVFSPTSDANINRNSRHINEETSEYLGQQIVDAIIFHVNANPKFKQLIAPGLTMRTTAFKEGTEYNKKRALHQVEFSEQLQAFFKKFMFDLEKITEKHVKKRMCHQIDKQSKHFLQTLLITPTESGNEKEKTENSEKMSPSSELSLGIKSDNNPDSLPFMATAFDRPETVNLNQMREKSLKPEHHVLDDLQVKQDHLLKLVNNYQNLSDVEKETHSNTYRSHLQELDQTSHVLATPKNQPYLIPTASFPAKNNFQNGTSHINNDNYDFDGTMKFEIKKPNDQNITPPDITGPSHSLNVISQNQPRSALSESSSDRPNTQTPDNVQPKTLPVYYFTEIKNPNEYTVPQTTTPYNPFESVYAVNETTTPSHEIKGKGNATQEFDPIENKNRQLAVPTPQTFDLLSSQSSTTEHNIALNNEFLDSKNYENIARNKIDKFNFEDYLYQPYGKPTELHKLSLGDAAGLQLSLKHQSPWVSNLDIAKTLRSVSEIPQSKLNVRAKQKNTDRFSDESRNPRSLVIPGKEYLAESSYSTRSNWNDKAKYFYTKPIFSSRVDKKFYTPKIRPFENAIHCKWPTKDPQTGPFEYFLRKGSPPNNKIRIKNTQGKSLQEENSLRKYFGKKRKRRISHFLIHHPKGGPKKHQNFKGSHTK